MDNVVSDVSANKKHPKGLYLLFVTEMAERFSYYGMRALFTLYLIAAFFTDGTASQIYGSYTGLVYLTPLLGGYIADRYWGNRRSIIVGGLIMALGQFCMFLSACFVQQSIFTKGGAIDPNVDNTLSIFLLFTGLVALILGNGFFKPNISTMVGDLYEPTDKRKDAAFTIFYMGINVGAFIAPLICGTLGEGTWNDLSPFKWGFLCACIGMCLSVAVFWFFKDKYLVTPEGLGIGLPPNQSELRKKKEIAEHQAVTHDDSSGQNFDDENNENSDENSENNDNSNENSVPLNTDDKIKDASEISSELEALKSPSDDDSLFDNTDDDEIKPRKTNSPIRLGACIFGAFVMFVLFSPLRSMLFGDVPDHSFTNYISAAVFSLSIALPVFIITDKTLSKTEKCRIGVIYIIAVFVIFFWSAFEQAGSSLTIFADRQVDRGILGFEFKTSYFQSVNPIVVVTFAPIMAMLWEKLSKKGHEPHSVVKQAIGLALLSVGYIVIALATKGLDPGIKVSMFWLIALYFLHTIGELCLSPIGLSMVNKLAPAHLASLLMGVWFMSNAASNILAGELATLLPEYHYAPKTLINLQLEQLDRFFPNINVPLPEVAPPTPRNLMGLEISTLDEFFLLFAVMAGAASILLFCISPILKKMMKGIN